MLILSNNPRRVTANLDLILMYKTIPLHRPKPIHQGEFQFTCLPMLPRYPNIWTSIKTSNGFTLQILPKTMRGSNDVEKSHVWTLVKSYISSFCSPNSRSDGNSDFFCITLTFRVFIESESNRNKDGGISRKIDWKRWLNFRQQKKNFNFHITACGF